MNTSRTPNQRFSTEKVTTCAPRSPLKWAVTASCLTLGVCVVVGMTGCASSPGEKVTLDLSSPAELSDATPGLAPPGEPDFKGVAPTREVERSELRGEASWYGKRHHGRLTANGEHFNMNGFTAAHRTLPFNTIVRVTDKTTRKTVVVRINDRGPYKESRIIDLSKAAASEIDIIKRGVTSVNLEILTWGDAARYRDGRKILPKKKRQAP